MLFRSITNTFLSKWAIYSVWIAKMSLALPIIVAGTMLPLVYYSKVINVLFYPKNFRKKSGTFAKRAEIYSSPAPMWERICLPIRLPATPMSNLPETY